MTTSGKIIVDLSRNTAWLPIVSGYDPEDPVPLGVRTVAFNHDRVVVHLDEKDRVLGVQLLESGPAKWNQMWFHLQEVLRRCVWTGERTERLDT